MQFFAVKSLAGYLKREGQSGLKQVDLAQASVFGPDQLRIAEDFADLAREMGFKNVTVMELTVVEKALPAVPKAF